MSLDTILKSLETIEQTLQTQSEKADGELKTLGKVSADTKAALDKLGVDQRELADRLLQLEQRRGAMPEGGEAKGDSWGKQFVGAALYKGAIESGGMRARVEIKNTVVGAAATVAPDRQAAIVPGAFPALTVESLYASVPTSSNAIEFTREASFVNNAAETAEGAVKPETDITFSLVNMPVSTVAHWIKISRQLASDAPALAAYIDTRMRFGVQRRVESQLISGNATAPNLSGLMRSGNFTPHGYLSGALGSTLARVVLIRRVIADLFNAGYTASAILLNAADWAQIEIELLTSVSNGVRVSYDMAGNPMLFGVRVVQSVGMAADTFAVGDFRQHGTIYNREDVTVAMSESDSDNFTRNLITLRAERRLALTSEVPAALRGGDLTPPAS